MTTTIRRSLSVLTMAAAIVALTLTSASAAQYPPEPTETDRGSNSASPAFSEAVFDSAARLLGVDPTQHPMTTLLANRSASGQRAASLAALAAGRSTPVIAIGDQLAGDGDSIVADLRSGEALELGICCVAPNELVTFELEPVTILGFRSTGRATTLGVVLTTDDGAAILDAVPPADLDAGSYQLVARTSDGSEVNELAVVLEVRDAGDAGSGSTLPIVAGVIALLVLGLGVRAWMAGGAKG